MTTKTPAKHQYSDREKDQALLELAKCSGNYAEAARQCEEITGLETVNRQTLRAWKTRYADRYAQIRDKYAAEGEKILAAKVDDVAVQWSEVQEKAIEQTLQGLHELPADKAARVGAEAAKAQAMMIEKARLLRDKPTSISAPQDLPTLFKELQRRFGNVIDIKAPQVLEGEAVEVNNDKLSDPPPPL